MNEPVAPGVNLDDLKNYYQAGYDAVRKYTSSAYVILSNRLGADPKELLSFAGNLNQAVIDVHYYNLFSDMFNNMDVQQNIDYINNQRASDLQTVTTSNGPLSFVGMCSKHLINAHLKISQSDLSAMSRKFHNPHVVGGILQGNGLQNLQKMEHQWKTTRDLQMLK
jgi:hypothetical protein